MAEQKQTELISTDKLELDPKNPRLPDSTDRTADKMLEYIARHTSIEELMSAIAENGFFQGEALIAYKKDKAKDKYIVIEGNRRLVAVWLLHNPDLYPRRKRIRDIAEAAEHKPKKLPVIVYDDRDDVLTYLGYRHITGVKQWDSLAKARYMNQLFRNTNKNEEPLVRYRHVARAIGSRRDHIKRSLDSLAVYREIEANDFYGIEELDETSISFSLLTTALAYPTIAVFAGSDADPIVKPTKLNKQNIELLTRWMFEKKADGETVLGESRNIPKLENVVQHEKALSTLKKGATLDYAYRLTAGVKDEFIAHLFDAQGSLQTANSFVASVKPDEIMFDVARDVSKLSKNIVRALQDQMPDED